MSSKDVLEIASYSTPYFRTSEFSQTMLQNEELMLKFLNAPDNSKCVFFTSSGTGAMESCIMNILNEEDKVIVVNGGTFGQRFVDLCRLHQRSYTEITCKFGCQLKEEQLYGLENHTAFLVNMHETSSGLLYDMPLITQFCKENNILLIIDAISAFIADEVDMKKFGAAAVITGSQKALAVQPGVAIIALAPQALERVKDNKDQCMYLSIKLALANGERGQTPFTPAVTTILQINKRLNTILESGGLLKERESIINLANDFRNKINGLPFKYVSESMSNAVTALHPITTNAKEVVRILKDNYQIWVCPNGGKEADTVFRVGHIGHITHENNQILIDSFRDMHKKRLL